MSKNKILLDIFFNVKHIPEQHIEAPIINFCSLIERLEVSLFFNSITHDFFDSLYDGLLPFGIATFVSVLINFSGQKFWVFRKD